MGCKGLLRMRHQTSQQSMPPIPKVAFKLFRVVCHDMDEIELASFWHFLTIS
jgi:hypothetical protein